MLDSTKDKLKFFIRCRDKEEALTELRALGLTISDEELDQIKQMCYSSFENSLCLSSKQLYDVAGGMKSRMQTENQKNFNGPAVKPTELNVSGVYAAPAELTVDYFALLALHNNRNPIVNEIDPGCENFDAMTPSPAKRMKLNPSQNSGNLNHLLGTE